MAPIIKLMFTIDLVHTVRYTCKWFLNIITTTTTAKKYLTKITFTIYSWDAVVGCRWYFEPNKKIKRCLVFRYGHTHTHTQTIGFISINSILIRKKKVFFCYCQKGTECFESWWRQWNDDVSVAVWIVSLPPLDIRLILCGLGCLDWKFVSETESEWRILGLCRWWLMVDGWWPTTDSFNCWWWWRERIVCCVEDCKTA